jgi:hypothetical protein
VTTRLNAINHNIHEACGTRVDRVQADLDSDIYDYFFHHVLCSIHGSRQALINFFFQKLFDECQEQGIPRVWNDEDLMGQKIVDIVNRLNFKDHGK